MKIGVTIKGGQKLAAAFDALEPAARLMFQVGLEKAAIVVHAEAVTSIQEHRSQGRAYRRGGKIHFASAPGNPPNTDRGGLVRGIKWELDQSALIAQVGTNVEYGARLEFGDSSRGLKPRPWLGPAYRVSRKEMMRYFNFKVRKGGG